MYLSLVVLTIAVKINPILSVWINSVGIDVVVLNIRPVVAVGIEIYTVLTVWINRVGIDIGVLDVRGTGIRVSVGVKIDTILTIWINSVRIYVSVLDVGVVVVNGGVEIYAVLTV